ncbi:MAG: urease accessory protein UreE [Pseudomonadota bacterium]
MKSVEFLFTSIVGHKTDSTIREPLHDLAHRGCVEYIRVSEQDAKRRRLRCRTDKGTECAIALPREIRLADGDVVLAEPDRAIVVRLGEERWLRLVARDADVCLQLGYHAGNLHWRVKFDGSHLLVALTEEPAAYIARIRNLFSEDEVVLDEHG